MLTWKETQREEGKKILSLSWPISIALIAQMSMGLVDMMMVGPFGAHALAAMAAALNIEVILGVVPRNAGAGVIPLVSQAWGANKKETTYAILRHLFTIGFFLQIPFLFGLYHVDTILRFLGQPAEIVDLATSYCRICMCGVPFGMGYYYLRYWLQAISIVKPATWAVIVANVANVGLNFVLIYGPFGMGVLGCAWSTVLCQMLQFLLLLYWTRSNISFRGVGSSIRTVFVYGVFSGIQIALEVWGFACATIMAGWLGEVALAAHSITLQLTSISFMIVLGISLGVSTRVGI
ncbi:MAG: MATE family efflux transporter, partial [Myxococcota bacterium]|nr:MATE family efflux transporter [Myxococcota bacterium]